MRRDLLQAELVAVEVERLLEVADAHHCMQIPHDLFSLAIRCQPRVSDYTLAVPVVTGAELELTRARIIFVPGLNPKPPPEIYRPQLERVLLAGAAPHAAARRRVARRARRRVRARRLDLLVPRRASRHQRRLAGHRAAARAVGADARRICASSRSWSRRLMRWTHLVGDAWPFLGRRLRARRARGGSCTRRRAI